MMALGALVTMNAVSNIVPDKIAALANETRAGNMLAARTLHFELFGLNKAVFYDTNPIPMKYMMKRLGILQNNEHRLPMMAASPAPEESLDRVLATAGLICYSGVRVFRDVARSASRPCRRIWSNTAQQ